MNQFVIIPDSSCDLSKDLRARFGIEDYARGVFYYPDGRETLSDLDWEQFTPEEFYNSMSGKNCIYQTACPTNGEYERVFENQLKDGRDVLYISLSSALSGSYSSAMHVAGELMEKYPGRKIICIDSKRYSTALALLVIHACMKKEEGASLEETARYTEEIKNKVHQMGTMDDLFFLVKKGRLSNFKAFFGTLVGVNPMADFNHEGLSEVLCKFKGKKSAFEATMQYMEKTIENPKDQIIFVAHSNRQKEADWLSSMIRERFSPKEIIINPVGMACGASVGPGLCAAFYAGKTISENLKDEKAIMAEIEKSLKNK